MCIYTYKTSLSFYPTLCQEPQTAPSSTNIRHHPTPPSGHTFFGTTTDSPFSGHRFSVQTPIQYYQIHKLDFSVKLLFNKSGGRRR
ncbi:hypothetical protein HanRHA438_Chr11g0508651 [Helianthus annuus]|uniref:Uncharacterized protein n=1 Tax=Helianthus annuus TaxID=4232 RepID=A0A9K3N0G7_HELAN|nr:hypothetical protein HanXRQr2_Chr11g0496021 [Helianthus annuus]KAJ0509872.1 hypothetical protein HanIR_Chr11g0534081 [Helianthus annuus]KAJ0871129.1 hypothetical protein HanRHA438_Chr11g0508651 [Helianthus annuus]KAJ0875578.1 hypothetical protein HanPSC8_Chr11g0478061 [Helianthus annuus]